MAGGRICLVGESGNRLVECLRWKWNREKGGLKPGTGVRNGSHREKEGKHDQWIVTGAMAIRGRPSGAGLMGRKWDEDGPTCARVFDERATTISTQMVALPAVLMPTRAKVSLASVGTAMIAHALRSATDQRRVSAMAQCNGSVSWLAARNRTIGPTTPGFRTEVGHVLVGAMVKDFGIYIAAQGSFVVDLGALLGGESCRSYKRPKLCGEFPEKRR
ncbi:hypothetical protein BJY52DRAFT_1229654 [Lactarius psammicola]|nr:hypothetical protein BJY52DRAFT_1229654 [Lactarius psammicola]